ncbi:MAG: hypothetical protein FWC39_01425 [Bacteroidetes bacterium]|nr:hypothetical protein [Bacteroidota bacterium]
MAKDNGLTWVQAIEKAIIELGYIATLKQIYELAPKYKTFSGLTPHKSINLMVQKYDNFVKIRPGLYGLKKYLDKLPDEYNPRIIKTEEEDNKITHSYVQGLLIEIGNIQGFDTFSPDKSGLFLNKKIGEIITQLEVPKFTYDNIVQSAKYIDVIWFNQRQFPNTIIEIENSTNFRNSLVKFVDLQDFNANMIMVAPNEQSKINKFQQEITKAAFASIKNRVKFYDYEYVEKLYNHQLASQSFKSFFL